MKFLIKLILSSLLILYNASVLANNNQNIPVCSPNLNESEVCYVFNLSQLHVAQFNYGEQYMNGLIDLYRNNTAQQNQTILDKIQFSLVISPDQKMYIANNIEQLLVFYKLSSRSSQYKFYFKILQKFPVDSTQSANEKFWSWMNNAHIAHLEDQGISKSVSQLPTNITQVKNDPFLSLSKWLGISGWCYDEHQKEKFNNIEFIWANYLRDLVNEGQLALYPDPNPTSPKDQQAKNIYIDYVKRVGVCHVNVADKLPGFCQYDHGCSVSNP